MSNAEPLLMPAVADAAKLHERPRLHVLDGLRGIAVMLVMAFHFTTYPHGGNLGVDLFFVLSGFLITTTILQDVTNFKPVHALRFYYGRVLRIVPALLEMLLLYSAIKLAWPDQVTYFRDNALSALFMYSNWTRAWKLPYPDYLGHTWSLSIECQFYLLWPLILLAFLRSKSGEKRLGIALALAIPALWTWRFWMASVHPDADRLYNRTDTRIDTILIGCLGAILSRRTWFREFVFANTALMKVLLAVGVAGAIASFAFSDYENLWTYRYGLEIVALSCAVIVVYVCTFSRGTLSTLLSWKPLAFIGKRSYAIYLFHFPIFLALLFIFKIPKGPEMALLAAPPTVALAALSWHFVEHPAILLRYKTL